MPATKNECTCQHIGPQVHDPTNPRCPYFSGEALRVTGYNDDEPTPADAVPVLTSCTCGLDGFHDASNKRCVLNRSDELLATALVTNSQIAMPSVILNVDINDLLRFYEGDEVQMFRIIVRLKDLLA